MSRRHGFALMVLLPAAACGVSACRRPPSEAAPALPAPPPVDLTAIDPRIAATIEKAKADVVRDPASARAWASLGAVLMTHKFHAGAIECFAETEKLQPNEPRWPYLQGVMLLTRTPGAALPKLARAAELAGATPPAPKLKLADALIERGQLDAAEQHLGDILKAHPDEAQALLGLGRVAMARGQFEPALGHLQRAAADPATARAALALIAGIQQRLGNSAAAAEASARVASMPDEPPMPDPFAGEISTMQTGLQAWLTHADRLFRAGRPREGLALLERTAAAYPDSSTAWRILGQGRLNEQDFAGAEQALLKARELSPEESVIHYTLGNALALQGRFAEAAEYFRKAAELWPAYAPAHFHLAQALEQEGNRAGAIEAYRAATWLDPAFAAAYRQLGAVLALDRRFPEAIAALERAVALDPSDRAAAEFLKNARAGL